MKKKILIIGSSGYLGKHLNKKLSKDNLIITSHSKKKKLIDICDYNNLEKYIKKNKIDYLINCSGQYSENLKKFKSTAIAGNRNIIRIAKKYDIKIILCSTTSIYENEKSNYSKTKLFVESLYKKSKIDYKILRIGNVYDTFLKKKGLLRNIKHYFNNKLNRLVINNPNIYRNFIHIEDFCNLVLLSLNSWKKTRKKIFVLSTENIKISKILSHFAKKYPSKKLKGQKLIIRNIQESSIFVKKSMFAYRYFKYTKSTYLLKTIKNL